MADRNARHQNKEIRRNHVVKAIRRTTEAPDGAERTRNNIQQRKLPLSVRPRAPQSRRPTMTADADIFNHL